MNYINKYIYRSTFILFLSLTGSSSGFAESKVTPVNPNSHNVVLGQVDLAKFSSEGAPLQVMINKVAKNDSANRTANFINALHLVKTPSGGYGGQLASDKSYQNMVESLIDAYTNANAENISPEKIHMDIKDYNKDKINLNDIYYAINKNTEVQINILNSENLLLEDIRSIIKAISAQNAVYLTDVSKSANLFK